jgi:vacuolar protein sorting-associated protein 35
MLFSSCVVDMCVFDQLRHLEMFFMDDYAKKPNAFHRLYESIQHCGNIVPRLYLLITVGSAYISVKPECSRDILEDMIEMCKGVQHPTRGLFLRYYLTQLCKNKLPDSKERDEINSYSLQWVLQNFIEMNRLWVRLQSKMLGGKKREQERMDLRILVGSNIVRLSQLECVSLDVYKSEILPKVLKEIIECKDRIAQQYLIDVIVQVFPDEFHLETLSQVLMATREFGFGVDIRSMLVGFMERLANFATGAMGSNELGLHRRKEIIQIFHDEIKHQMRVSMQAHFILEGEILPMMSLEDLLTTVIGLSTMALRLDPASTETMDTILKMILDGLSVAAKDVLEDRNVIRGLQRLFHIPINEYKNTIKVLSLNNISDGCTYLTPIERRRLALDFLRSSLEFGDLLSTPEHVERFFLMIEPLVVDPSPAPGSGTTEEQEKESGVLSYRPEKEDVNDQEEEFDEEEFAEEQNLVSQIVHLISLEDLDLHFKLLGGVRKMFAKGGARRLLFTLPSLAMGFLRLISAVGRRLLAGETFETPIAKIFKYALDTIHVLRSHRADVALKIYLEGALVADITDDEDHTYEFLSRAFVIYEEDIADSKLQCMYHKLSSVHYCMYVYVYVYVSHSDNTVCWKCADQIIASNSS